ncbi:citrulline utilization hydrolase CtlX [Psychromonas ossibalaenae]|uniref:citrulline utilization hydrolase CtlX n=1 Tax=Psychromonas ossibalaenae TaxID=444922 RepID=UPI0003757FA6|nr:arginine deiminase-related protein [Psychromonas ossibalaenae]
MALIQAPAAVIMIRPWKFFSNPETAADNAFQAESGRPSCEVALQARQEFDNVVDMVQKCGIKVHVFDDFGEKNTPDSVFPNNWISTHSGGHVALYPMCSLNRRGERRTDVIEMLKSQYRVQDVVDFSGLEMDGLYLEGTGAMVLDNVNRIAYSAKSNRASEVILERFCSQFLYEPMAFNTKHASGKAVYHTNVMMCVCSDYALVCLEMIKNKIRRVVIKQRLIDCGLEVINLSFAQVDNFAGNAIELTGKKGQSYLFMSLRAKNSLTEEQLNKIELYSKIIAVNVETIELGGGSIRCMMAGIHLNPRN